LSSNPRKHWLATPSNPELPFSMAMSNIRGGLTAQTRKRLSERLPTCCAPPDQPMKRSYYLPSGLPPPQVSAFKPPHHNEVCCPRPPDQRSNPAVTGWYGLCWQPTMVLFAICQKVASENSTFAQVPQVLVFAYWGKACTRRSLRNGRPMATSPAIETKRSWPTRWNATAPLTCFSTSSRKKENWSSHADLSVLITLAKLPDRIKANHENGCVGA
jgi:hypothetical protein